MPIKVTLHRLQNANPRQEDIMERGRANLEKAVNHASFKDRVANTRFPEARFKDRRGRITTKSSAEVAAIILAGLERDTQQDAEIDLEIILDNIPSPTVGSTTPGRLPFRTAYWFVDGCVRRNDTVSPARHMIHEWLHVAGFVHLRNDGPRRDVPYMVGDIVRSLLSDRSFAPEAFEDKEMATALDEAKEEILISLDDLEEGEDGKSER